VPPESRSCLAPAVRGPVCRPSHAPVLAGIAFDRTGTTCIGNYVFNHSFMLPGLITCTVSVAIGLGLAGMLL